MRISMHPPLLQLMNKKTFSTNLTAISLVLYLILQNQAKANTVTQHPMPVSINDINQSTPDDNTPDDLPIIKETHEITEPSSVVLNKPLDTSNHEHLDSVDPVFETQLDQEDFQAEIQFLPQNNVNSLSIEVPSTQLLSFEQPMVNANLINEEIDSEPTSDSSSESNSVKSNESSTIQVGIVTSVALGGMVASLSKVEIKKSDDEENESSGSSGGGGHGGGNLIDTTNVADIASTDMLSLVDDVLVVNAVIETSGSETSGSETSGSDMGDMGDMGDMAGSVH